MSVLGKALRGGLVLGSIVALSACGSSSSSSSSSAAAGGGTLDTRLSKSLRSPFVSLGRTAAMAVDLETGAVLFSHNPTTSVIPASNEKLPVAWPALVMFASPWQVIHEACGTKLYSVTVLPSRTARPVLSVKSVCDPLRQ